MMMIAPVVVCVVPNLGVTRFVLCVLWLASAGGQEAESSYRPF